MMTTVKQVRETFWTQHPDLPRRRYRYSWNGSGGELVYPVDTRCAFVDFVDHLQRNGEISESLAARVTLK
jgi:hypothetical protein